MRYMSARAAFPQQEPARSSPCHLEYKVGGDKDDEIDANQIHQEIENEKKKL